LIMLEAYRQRAVKTPRGRLAPGGQTKEARLEQVSRIEKQIEPGPFIRSLY